MLELFTSQGCDTCPPADHVLASYAQRPDIIAISLPVDIWDYLGWKDTLASDKNSERQKFYAKARGDGAIYTPQVVVNGMIGVNGSDPSRHRQGDQDDRRGAARTCACRSASGTSATRSSSRPATRRPA